MSTANELLARMSDEDFAAYSADSTIEEHIVVDSDRIIHVPEALRRIAVQFDHDIETVTFDCPRYWDEHDMSKMVVYINYMRKDGYCDSYVAQNIAVDETDRNSMHFTWTISRNVTAVKGEISFLVCVKNTNDSGEEVNHWNSELCQDMYVSEGLECMESIISPYPDLITQLLLRMDYVETIATPESMQNYIETFLTEGKGQDELKELIYEYMISTDPTSEEFMAEFVKMYLDKNPPLFIIGPDKPGIKCLWFDTSEGDSAESGTTTVLKMTSDGDSGMYAQVEDVGPTTEYDYTIK